MDSENFDDEMDLINQFEALDGIDETSDVCIGGGADISKDEIVDNCDSLQLKGFSTRDFGKMRLTANLPLMSMMSEVFTHEIRCALFPLKMTERELINLFEQYGRVYKMARNVERGGIFVSYTERKDAENAVKHLHLSKIEGREVKVFGSSKGGQLIVRHIPTYLNKKDLMAIFTSLIPSIHLLNVHVYNDNIDETKNRGFCFLDYGLRHVARSAMEILSKTRCFGDRPLCVEWPYRDAITTRDTLFISNLRNGIGHNELMKIFTVYGPITKLQQQHNQHCALITFKNENDAIRAEREVKRNILGNENLDISFNKLERRCKEPNRNATLYIENLSSHWSSSDLRKMFSVYGDVLDIDRDINFAAVRFQNAEEFGRALRNFDKKRLGNNTQISGVKPAKPHDQNVVKPSDTMYISNLPPSITVSNLRNCFPFHKNVEINKNGNTASVRFCDSDTDRLTALDLDKFSLSDDIQISFDKPLSGNAMKPSDTLCIYNMHDGMTVGRLRDICGVYGLVNEMEINGNFASVRYTIIDDAMLAFRKIQRSLLGGDNLRVVYR